MKRIQISDLGRVVTGHTPPTHRSDYYGDAYRLIMPTDMVLGERYVPKTAEGVSAEWAELKAKSLLPKHTSCVVTIGTIGKICLTAEPCFTNQAVNGVIADRSRFDPFYVFYLLRTVVSEVKHLSSGTASGRENVSKSAFSSIEISVVPLQSQRKIAGVLSAYDDLIENNTRRIAILEELAQAIYREWFVHFRYPGHENTPLVDSPFGKIPQGWKPTRLGDLAGEVRRGVDPSQVDPDTPYFGLEHLPRKSITLRDWGHARDVQSTKLKFRKGEILFGKIRPYFHKVGVAPVDGVCSSDAIVISPKTESAFGQVLCCVSSEDFVRHATQTSQGTKMPRANWDVLVKYALPTPHGQLLDDFNGSIRDIVDTLRALMLKNRNLRQTRDILLPKLISGQLDVADLDIDTGELLGEPNA